MSSPDQAIWTRRRFVGASTAAVATILSGCGLGSSDFDGRVLIVGAGPAGMTAAHLLRQQGVEIEVLEAGPTHGGRTRLDLDFADFPIPLGAEWVHVDGSILDEIVNDPNVEVTTQLLEYQADDRVAYIGDGVELGPVVPDLFGVDTKFRGSGWLDFYDTYVVPGIADAIRYDTPVTAIDHTGERVEITDASGDVHVADRAIVTVPLKILQLGEISFEPPLEPERLETIDKAVVWSGFKAFFEFGEKFYPAAVAPEDAETFGGQRLFYDAAYGQETDQHILGVFSVGAQAEAYQAMSENDFLADVLTELDEAFDGAASRTYERHRIQNWNAEPYARAAYLEDNADWRITRELAEPLSDLVHFAGDAYTRFDDWSSVHTAARSAADTVERLLG